MPTKQALIESESRLRSLFELSAVGMAECDLRSGKLLRVNSRLCAFLGYPPEELTGLDVRRITHSEDWSQDREGFGGLASCEASEYVAEKRFMTRDGRVVWGEVHLAPLQSSPDSPRFVVAVIDIGKRRQAEEARRASESLYRGVLETSSDGFWFTDTDGRLLEVNDAYIVDSGYTRAELLAMRIFDLDAAETPAETAAHIEKVMRSGADRFASTHRRRNGTLWPVEVSTTYLSIAGGRFCVFVRNLTLQRSIEVAQRQSRERLEMLTRRLVDTQEAERSRIARELHDQLGQALTAVRLNLLALRRTTASAADAALVNEALATVDASSSGMRTLAFDLRPPMLDDLGLVPALQAYATRAAERGGLRLVLESGAADMTDHPEIGIACYRIAQEAITNVLRHAGASTLRISTSHSDAMFQMRIEDDGIGMQYTLPGQGAPGEPNSRHAMGLNTMAERASLAGGRIVIAPRAGGGTSVLAEFDLRGPEQ